MKGSLHVTNLVSSGPLIVPLNSVDKLVVSLLLAHLFLIVPYHIQVVKAFQHPTWKSHYSNSLFIKHFFYLPHYLRQQFY